MPVTPGENGGGLGRKHILSGIDASLRRLKMDHVDLYQIHRWDPRTPIEETMEALHDVVRSGKARYIGASSMFAWQFAKAQHTAECHGWTKFVSMQNHYNLIYREEEREMIPLCLDQGSAAFPGARWPVACWPATAPARVVAHDALEHRPLHGLPLLASRPTSTSSTPWTKWREAARRPPAQVALAWLLGEARCHGADRGLDEGAASERCAGRRGAGA